MEPIDIHQTSSTPQVSFKEAAKTMIIIGESYPENSFTFYAPVLAWLKQYLQQHDELTLDINVTYMNSSSTKCMLDMLDLLEEAYARTLKVAIVWRYDIENPRSFELAEEFCEEVTFPFEIVALN